MGLTRVSGMDPDRMARCSALVTECRPVLESDAGMDGVQELLSRRGVWVMDAIVVTRELLGAGPESLRAAKSIILLSPSRSVERQNHEALVEDLLHAVEHIADDGGRHE